MLYDLILFQKLYDFLVWLHPVLGKFPKNQKFVLAQRIENKALDILNSVIWANAETDKTRYLKRAGIELDELRILIRLSKDFRLISSKQYEVSAEKMNEIGKILYGYAGRFSKATG